MTQETIDFQFFKDNQLKAVDFATGRLDVFMAYKSTPKARTALNVGSKNQDGYIRVWCNSKLRMKHRLLFWLYHGHLPIEVDHDDNVRCNNGITNLLASTRKHNTVGKAPRSYKQLKVGEVMDLCYEIAHSNLTITELAKRFNRSRCQIKGIMVKKYWKEISDEYF